MASTQITTLNANFQQIQVIWSCFLYSNWILFWRYEPHSITIFSLNSNQITINHRSHSTKEVWNYQRWPMMKLVIQIKHKFVQHILTWARVFRSTLAVFEPVKWYLWWLMLISNWYIFQIWSKVWAYFDSKNISWPVRTKTMHS